MKLRFYNDSKTVLRVHPGSVPCDMAEVPPLTLAVFDLPDDADPFVKVWSAVVLVQDFKR
jgi:hypothetical protein